LLLNIVIEEELPLILDSLKVLRSQPVYDSLNSVPPRTLQNLIQEWTIYLNKLEGWEKVLLTRSQALEEQKNQVQEMSATWAITAEAAIAEEAPEAIRERIESTLSVIDSVETGLVERINILLVLQNRISKQQIEISELISQIRNSEAQLRTRLFVRDSPPLWEAFRAGEDSLHFGAQFRESWQGFFRANMAFVRANEDRFYLHLTIFALLLAFMIYLNRRNKQDKLFDEHDDTLKASAFFVSRPFSAALLIALFLSIWIYSGGTVSVGEFIMLLLVIPVLRLVPGLYAPEIHKPAYLLAGLYVLDIFYKYVDGFILLQRLLLLFITVAAIPLLFWLIRPGSPVYKLQPRPWPKLLLRLSPLVLITLLISLTANIYGNVSLAHLLTAGVVESAQLMIVLYAAALVIDGLATLLIRRRRAHALRFVKAYGGRIERWAVVTIHLIAFLVWLRATFRAFGFYQPFQHWFSELLAKQWTFGTVTVSVQSIFDFVLILALALILSRLIRIVLDLEVFPRVRLPRGIPGAISMVVRYTVVGLGILLAISSLGLDLGKFGLLAGALGVGLGFGLQNVIANFVSGLILAFERPIQVGDKIEVGTVLGNVKQIGVRSSTVKTFDGSEVIVPNADLISNQVTNWTLSDARQRMKLPVKVAFDSEPEEVLEILLKIAREHPGILKDPEPVAVFNGFGDYFLDFTLYYWVSGNIFQIQTEVALGVHRSIKEAGIEKPRPQQDLLLRIIKEPGKKRLPGEDEDKIESVD
jgi:small-conductance mechanosensitive channel